jgi:hypothetical protein
VRVGTLVSAGLAALGFVLFIVKVTYLGEGYDGSWGDVVIVVAWLAMFGALGVALATAIGLAGRLRRRL